MTRVNQGLFSTTMEAEKRDPGNEVETGVVTVERNYKISMGIGKRREILVFL